MNLQISSMRFPTRLATLALTAFFAACSETTTTDPGNQSQLTGGSTQNDFSSASLSQASNEISGHAGLRIEVRIKPGSDPLVASEVALDHPNMVGEPERVEGNLVEFDGAEGTITTDLGGLKISFGAATVFSRGETDAPLTLEEVAAALIEALANGQRLHISARRAAPDTPQAPDDGSFVADEIRIGGNSDALRVDLNVDRDNLELNTSPPPDAWLKLLGLSVELRVSEGITRIGFRRDPVGKELEFRGVVTEVNVDRHAFKLESGAVIRLNDQTAIDPEGGLTTLMQVHRALEAGMVVTARGEARVESLDPRVLIALEVRFDAHQPVFEFREGVKEVDAVSGKLVLTNGALLCFTPNSVIDPDGDFDTLEEVAAALASGKPVGAVGAAAQSPDDTGCRAVVLKVRFVLREPLVIEFREGVKEVDLNANTIVLTNGVTLCVDEHSVIDPDGDFDTLAEVAAALDEGKLVGAIGAATPAGNATTNVTACRGLVLKVQFLARQPPIVDFHEMVTAVDATAGTITLGNGVVLCLVNTTVIDSSGDLGSLADVAAALADGKAVRAGGKVGPGLSSAAHCRGTIIEVKFEVDNSAP